MKQGIRRWGLLLLYILGISGISYLGVHSLTTAKIKFFLIILGMLIFFFEICRVVYKDFKQKGLLGNEETQRRKFLVFFRWLGWLFLFALNIVLITFFLIPMITDIPSVISNQISIVSGTPSKVEEGSGKSRGWYQTVTVRDKQLTFILTPSINKSDSYVFYYLPHSNYGLYGIRIAKNTEESPKLDLGQVAWKNFESTHFKVFTDFGDPEVDANLLESTYQDLNNKQMPEFKTSVPKPSIYILASKNNDFNKNHIMSNYYQNDNLAYVDLTTGMGNLTRVIPAIYLTGNNYRTAGMTQYYEKIVGYFVSQDQKTSEIVLKGGYKSPLRMNRIKQDGIPFSLESMLTNDYSQNNYTGLFMVFLQQKGVLEEFLRSSKIDAEELQSLLQETSPKIQTEFNQWVQDGGEYLTQSFISDNKISFSEELRKRLTKTFPDY